MRRLRESHASLPPPPPPVRPSARQSAQLHAATPLGIWGEQHPRRFRRVRFCLSRNACTCARSTARELPISIYESEVHVVDDKPQTQFAVVPYKIDSIESERIAVDHIAHILPTGGSSSGSAFTQHVGTQYTAVSMLTERVDVITRYLGAVSAGQVPTDHELLRHIKSLCERLPALDTEAFRDESMRDFNNTLLVAYLGCITKGTGIVNDVVDKYNTAYDKHSRRRGIF